MALRLRMAFIPAGNANRPGLRLYGESPDFLTVHETGNRDNGANAEMHRRFTHNGGGTDRVSFHWTVDDHEAIQLLPHDETAWHAGDGAGGTGNRDSIAIEVCVNADGDWARTKANLIGLLARLCRELRLGPERIRQHYDWSGKNCPERLRRGEWEGLLSAVRAVLQPGAMRYFTETGHSVGHAFLAYWQTLPETQAIAIFGYPLSEEEEEHGRTVQYFERAVFEHHPEAPAPWRVQLRRLGARALAAKLAPPADLEAELEAAPAPEDEPDEAA